MLKIVDYRENFYVVKQLNNDIRRENKYLNDIKHVRSS